MIMLTSILLPGVKEDSVMEVGLHRTNHAHRDIYVPCFIPAFTTLI